MNRRQLVGDASKMGSESEVEKDLTALDALERELVKRERELEVEEATNRKLARRGTKGLKLVP